MYLLWKSISRMIPIAMLSLLAVPSMPPAMAFQMNEDVRRWIPVSEAVLADMRGGFQRGPDGPFMSFGIERNVFLDEKLASSTRLNISDMTRLADLRNFNPLADREMKSVADPSDMRAFGDRPSDAFTFIHSGHGDSMHTSLSDLPPFMTAIQNSQDNRTIQSETVINAAVHALTWAQSLDLGNALSQASIEAIRH
jgi:hypothetical protein